MKHITNFRSLRKYIVYTIIISTFTLLQNIAFAENTMIPNGTIVSVNYIGKFEDGKVFDTSIVSVAKKAWIYQTSRMYTPLSFVVWENAVIKWFEDAIRTMTVGTTKIVTIEPKDAYWDVDLKKEENLPLSSFTDAKITPKIWERYTINWTVVIVKRINWNTVVIDGNNPMAWKKLIFTITLVSALQKLPGDLVWLQQWHLELQQIRGLMKSTFREGTTTWPILMIEYSDPACPFCIRQFTDRTIDQVLAQYPTQVEYIYKPVQWVNHPTTEYDSYAILCAGKVWWIDAYKGMYRSILGNSTIERPVDNKNIISYVKKLAINEPTWSACMSKKQMSSQYARNRNEFTKISPLPGTPSTLLVNKNTWNRIMIAGAYPVNVFFQAVDFLLQ
jgi:peptidylprolyl isomerase